ncbi:MAG TPA: zinc-binding alcohol dehydrogenase [Jatrophihabitans sp.]|jgi:2-desacetyl-2-hydroxyethyl bacteriochlorophyllide A dehydrogenase|uniref:zinc-dependent alcohol dehydrogenase n=1 Tax=Jatrophihabitans sp. TaxID=1932789 RepID=UPI002F01FB6D
MTEPPAEVVRFLGARSVDLHPTAPLTPAPDQVRLRTRYSGISSGTEMATYTGSNPHLHRRWDADSQLFLDGAPSIKYPVVGAGYEEVGEVVEVGADTDGVEVGDIVWGVWGHRSDGVMLGLDAAAQKLPAAIDPLVGVFARVGAVALNAVIDADVHVGETVAVFGQGVIGLLATRLLALSGVDVVAVDLEPDRLRLSRELGARHTLLAADSPAAAVRNVTGGLGADVCIELSGSYPALQEAIRTCGYSGRVIAAGFYQGDATALRLGEEFHHNRIELVSSQISGSAARYERRWSRQRLHRGFMRLVADGRVDPLPLVSRVLPAAEVSQAFELIASNPEVLQVVLDFNPKAI